MQNKDLEFTHEVEIKRLRKVIEEKNRCIEAFKKYDAERKEHYRNFEANYKYIEEEFARFVKAVDEDCNHTTAKQVSSLLCNFKNYSYGTRFNRLQGQVESARVNVEKLRDAIESLVLSETYILSYTDRDKYDSLLNVVRGRLAKVEKILEKKLD